MDNHIILSIELGLLKTCKQCGELKWYELFPKDKKARKNFCRKCHYIKYKPNTESMKEYLSVYSKDRNRKRPVVINDKGLVKRSNKNAQNVLFMTLDEIKEYNKNALIYYYNTKLESLQSSIVVLDHYKNAHTKVGCICKVCAHKWGATPNNLFAGKGCPACARDANNIALRAAISNGKPTTLYYIHFPEYNVWKIGCTSKTIDWRFRLDRIDFIIVLQQTFDDSSEAYTIEKEILTKSIDYKYTGDKILNGGNSELRTIDISKLDWFEKYF